MDYWAYDKTYRSVLHELPKILDVIRRADIGWYVIHGRAASILQSVRRTGTSRLATKDMDFLVKSNDAVRRIYDVVTSGEDAGPGETRKPIYDSVPVYGSLDGAENIGMRGLDMTADSGMRIEVRNALFYMDGRNPNNNITTGDKTASEVVCLPREKTGYVEDLFVSLRPTDLLKKDYKELAEHFGRQRELSLGTLKELERLV